LHPTTPLQCVERDKGVGSSFFLGPRGSAAPRVLPFLTVSPSRVLPHHDFITSRDQLPWTSPLCLSDSPLTRGTSPLSPQREGDSLAFPVVTASIYPLNQEGGVVCLSFLDFAHFGDSGTYFASLDTRPNGSRGVSPPLRFL